MIWEVKKHSRNVSFQIENAAENQASIPVFSKLLHKVVGTLQPVLLAGASLRVE